MAILAAALLAGPVLAQEGGQVFQPMDQFVVRPIEGTGGFGPYAHALASLALWVLLMAALLVGSVAGAPRARTDAGTPARDYSDPAYRRHRAFANAVETSGMFVAAVAAAVLAGAPPFWVNLLASAFLVARVAMAGVHWFTEIHVLRSVLWTAASLCVLGLALMALGAALW